MSQEDQNLYEGMYVLSATLSEDAREKAITKIESEISERGGEVLKRHDQGRRKLAYEIDGKREGCYYLLYFKLEPSKMKELWAEYRLNEDLLRFMTLRAEEVMEEIKFRPLVEQA